MKSLFKQSALAATIAASATAAQAETFWTNTSLSLLSGSDYVNPYLEAEGSDSESDGTVLTFEHAGAYNWGKSFSFIDIINSSDTSINANETYLELGADFSLTGGKGFSGLVKDVYLVTQLENANPSGLESKTNYLGGVGARWNVPGFVFFDTNVYYRANEKKDDDAQLTVAWGLPFKIGATSLSFDGFFDATTGYDSDDDFGGQAIFHAQPQLKLDLGNFWGQSNKYYVGVEVDYWKNKFGVDGADQTTVQAMAQINF